MPKKLSHNETGGGNDNQRSVKSTPIITTAFKGMGKERMSFHHDHP